MASWLERVRTAILDRFSPGERPAEEPTVPDDGSSKKRPSPNSWLGNEPRAAQLGDKRQVMHNIAVLGVGRV